MLFRSVEGALRDPASLNKPSTLPLTEGIRIGGIAGSDVHWGLALGVVACIGLGLWLRATASGFSIRVVGGNPRTAQLVGLPASRLILLACALGGACAGLAGAAPDPAAPWPAVVPSPDSPEMNSALRLFLGLTALSFIPRSEEHTSELQSH